MKLNAPDSATDKVPQPQLAIAVLFSGWRTRGCRMIVWSQNVYVGGPQINNAPK